MRLSGFFGSCAALVLSVEALASPTPSPLSPAEGTPSRALQQAKRVASMENENDLPSRAVWLGQRAARQAKLALKATTQKPSKRSK